MIYALFFRFHCFIPLSNGENALKMKRYAETKQLRSIMITRIRFCNSKLQSAPKSGPFF